MIDLRLALDDGTVRTVRTRPADHAAWERHTGRPSSLFLADDGTGTPAVRFDDLLWIAWHADTRGTDPRPEYTSWADRVTEIELAGDAPADPTRPAP